MLKIAKIWFFLKLILYQLEKNFQDLFSDFGIDDNI